MIFVKPTEEERARAELDRLARQIRDSRLREEEAVRVKSGAWAEQMARRRIALQESYDRVHLRLVRGW